MKLAIRVTAFVFVVGAVATLIGDHSHIATGTTYFAFGVVVALLAEIATSSVDSAVKAGLPE